MSCSMGRGLGRQPMLVGGSKGLLLGVVLALALPVHAQPESPEDWPCIQALIPEVNPSVLWPIPIGESLAGSWRGDSEIRSLAERFGELESVDDSTLAAMDAFAESVDETERQDALTRLADGTVSVANVRRGRYIDGIRRYTQQQIAISGQIVGTLNQLAELDDSALAEASGADDAEKPGVAVSVDERAEIEATLAWHERLYDQRERAIRALCERPVELEETLSEVLRELFYRLPD